jgi:hypothetical protein
LRDVAKHDANFVMGMCLASCERKHSSQLEITSMRTQHRALPGNVPHDPPSAFDGS